jgi:hypothetical protein
MCPISKSAVLAQFARNQRGLYWLAATSQCWPRACGSIGDAVLFAAQTNGCARCGLLPRTVMAIVEAVHLPEVMVVSSSQPSLAAAFDLLRATTIGANSPVVAFDGPSFARARSSAVEHTLHTGGVTGSIPVAPTMISSTYHENVPIVVQCARGCCTNSTKFPSRSVLPGGHGGRRLLPLPDRQFR